MSTRSGQADGHRTIARAEELYKRSTRAAPASWTVPHDADLDYVGAHFLPGSRKGSVPAYPEGVEFSEDEASSMQPDTATPRTISPPQGQYSRSGEPLRYSPSTPTRHLERDHFSVSPEDFKEIIRQRSRRRRHGNDSVHSHQTWESTPTQTHKDFMSSVSSRSHHDGPAAPPTHDPYAASASASMYFTEPYTPSRRSAATDDNGTHRDAMGPSPPHPFSEWDLRKNDYRPGDDREYGQDRSGEDPL
ncbi:hypothetical protein E8E13_009053 [Curvularia kusanoi]|uniref:Uncharacterized protein n=1 Tax=Curvularia kusanoi TaxID=90978 RepID=A0A9P4THY4_CURKU|nr:hypothetical protein E8E13_009053 [Curvularia kusanoi]